MNAIEASIAAYQGGEYQQAQRLLDGDAGAAGELLLVRIETRLGNTTAALTRVATLERRHRLSENERLEAALLEAALLVRSNDVKGARRRVEDAKSALNPASSATLESELWYVEALIYFALKNYATSEKSAWNAVHADLDLRARSLRDRGAHVAPIATTKARALQLIGLIRASQERYHEHNRILREAITIMKTSPSQDLYVISRLYVIRSYYARDFGIVGDIVEFELVQNQSWPDDLAHVHVEIDRSLAFLYSLAGDDEAAERTIGRARSTTPSEVSRLSSLSDEAFFARQRTDRGILKPQLLSAVRQVDAIDWDHADFERYALVNFARELAFVDPQRALGYVTLFENLSSSISPLILIDRRTKADDDYSIALVLLANGYVERAIRLLSGCFETWMSIGYRWLATLAALELTSLVESKHYLDYALRESEQYPRSWLRRRALAAAEEASIRR